MGRNYYSEAMDIIEKNQNWREIVVTIAKKHPKMVVDATPKQPLSWQDQCRAIRDNDSLVKSVKLCRELTGMALKEAVDACKML